MEKKIRTIKVIAIRDVITDETQFRQFIESLVEAKVGFTWGTNDRSLIDPDRLYEAVDEAFSADWEFTASCLDAIDTVCALKIRNFGLLIDMEN